ncbi:2OG-Fe(II) oxygenase [Nioella aestuarii]|uniref:2OG-Fe(II) oxygenase n=1 Tax=Nioella aestuarii TaxID=1662864 RepID=UPI003D7F2F53
MIQIHTVAAAFSSEECAHITTLAETAPATDAGLTRNATDHNLRRADLVWLDEVEGSNWVMDKIIALVREANRQVYGYDLTDFSESAQVARYGADRQGHFDWHSDIGDGRLASRRKLTMVVQLSVPSAYSGGQLELMPGAGTVTADTAQGAATIFPSFVLHRVTPVTDGERRSLTIWCHGPAFR